MILLYFIYGLAFEGLGLASYLQLRREGDFPLKKELPWLVAFGIIGGAAGWADMFWASGSLAGMENVLSNARVILHLLTGIVILRFGWGILNNLDPLPAWSIFIPGILIVPIAFAITYASTTFITPSPIQIPIEIWTRYLLYLPGSLLAGIGFLRQWYIQRKQGLFDVSILMLGAGIAFLFEAVVMGLIVPAAPYGPASYYNYDRVISNAFSSDGLNGVQPYGLSMLWLDYDSVLNTTGIPIEIWRMLSAIIVMFFVVKALDVFEAIRKRQVLALQADRDQAQRDAFEAQILARETAESWTNALVNISRRIAELDHVDDILVYIVKTIHELLPSNFVGVAIFNQENSFLELKCFATDQEVALLADTSIVVLNPLITDAIQSSRSYRSTGNEPEEVFKELCFFTPQQAQAVMITPLKLENTTIGVLWITQGQQQYNETDLIWLESMADQVAIAIQHGLMTSQLQSLSIVEERGRIAREMHDGLAQVLGYLNLQVQTLDSLLNQGKTEKVHSELVQMRQAIQTAHADVRENILSLRTTLGQEKSLQAAVAEYLTEFGIQTGVKTGFAYEINGELNLSSVAEVQLVCILQEALTNVRKHARASTVNVKICKTPNGYDDQIYMEIADDGVGFVAAKSKRSFGLQTMRERAESVNGTLMIQSVDQTGTHVQCWLPCLQPEQLQKQSVVIR